MSPERICLFFTNFSLVRVSQHNANSITILISIQRYSNSINNSLSPFYRFICVSDDRHIALNQSAASMTL